METVETIASICSGSGGAISIIRISGPSVITIISQIWRGRSLIDHPRELILGHLSFNGKEIKEPLLGVFMRNPHSFTGEDVMEIQAHGGVLNIQQILREVLNLPSVRQAQPGEFSKRAFLNGKMDLTQAEAIADLISAQSEVALQIAQQHLSGSLKNQIITLRKRLLQILSECESQLDFSEESLDWQSDETLSMQVNEVKKQIIKMQKTAYEGVVFRDGIRLAIAGSPNVGKSSLLNYLLGYDRAIVTDIAGTTRDSLEEQVQIRGIPFRLTDTAGIRQSTDKIEQVGIDRSKVIIQQSQIILWVLDASTATENIPVLLKTLIEDPIINQRLIVVWNKIDLCSGNFQIPNIFSTQVAVSAVAGDGFDSLFDIIETMVWKQPDHSLPEYAVNLRQADLLKEAIVALSSVPELIMAAHGNGETFDIVVIHLREAMEALGKIVGETVSPDLLEDIFSRFCIGK